MGHTYNFWVIWFATFSQYLRNEIISHNLYGINWFRFSGTWSSISCFYSWTLRNCHRITPFRGFLFVLFIFQQFVIPFHHLITTMDGTLVNTTIKSSQILTQQKLPLRTQCHNRCLMIKGPTWSFRNRCWSQCEMVKTFQISYLRPQGLYSLRRRRLTGIWIPMINLRRSDDRLRFIMGIPLLIRRRLVSQ